MGHFGKASDSYGVDVPSAPSDDDASCCRYMVSNDRSEVSLVTVGVPYLYFFIFAMYTFVGFVESLSILSNLDSRLPYKDRECRLTYIWCHSMVFL